MVKGEEKKEVASPEIILRYRIISVTLKSLLSVLFTPALSDYPCMCLTSTIRKL